ncbi:hypothetical protein [Vibrio campbellii]|uniref:hypothetical protein n=1 Tax=Vibrio campbellii TaxID=680 RepID=UPI003857B32F
MLSENDGLESIITIIKNSIDDGQSLASIIDELADWGMPRNVAKRLVHKVWLELHLAKFSLYTPELTLISKLMRGSSMFLVFGVAGCIASIFASFVLSLIASLLHLIPHIGGLLFDLMIIAEKSVGVLLGIIFGVIASGYGTIAGVIGGVLGSFFAVFLIGNGYLW